MTPAQQKLTIMVVSYNTREMTLACLRSVVEETCQIPFEIIVVDNASSDGSADAIEAEFPDIRLVRSPENLGFARANNVAASYATGERLLLLNPDTVILDQAIDHLAAFAQQYPAARIWGGRTLFADGTLNPTSCWNFETLWSLFVRAIGLSALMRNSVLFNSEALGGWQRDTVREVGFISGSFLLIDHEIWKKLEGFDENFFMFSEEADLGYRACKIGARPMFTPAATIIHYGGASQKMLRSKAIMIFCGKVSFFRKHWPWPKRVLGVALLKAMILARAAGYTAFSFLNHNEKHAYLAREWRSVWSQRRRWGKGFPLQP